jgi:hypothetical protein
VYVCGLDFAHRGLQTHSRPYAFERFHDENSFRTEPRYSQIFKREAMIRASGSLGIYASWLQTHLDSYPKRLFTIGPSIHGIPAGLPSKNKAGKKITVAFRQNTAEQNLAQKTSGKQLAGVLLESIDNPLLSAQLCNELGELLVDGKPAGEKALAASVKNALLELL